MIKVESSKVASYGHADVYTSAVVIDCRKELLTVELFEILKNCYKADRDLTLAAVERFLAEELDNDETNKHND